MQVGGAGRAQGVEKDYSRRTAGDAVGEARALRHMLPPVLTPRLKLTSALQRLKSVRKIRVDAGYGYETGRSQMRTFIETLQAWYRLSFDSACYHYMAERGPRIS